MLLCAHAFLYRGIDIVFLCLYILYRHTYTHIMHAYNYTRLWNEEFVRVQIPLSSLIIQFRGDDIKRKKGLASCDRQTGITNIMPLSIKHIIVMDKHITLYIYRQIVNAI